VERCATKDATRCYVFEYFDADDLPCIGPATIDIGVEVPHGQSWELLATTGEFRDQCLMLQLDPHKDSLVSWGGLNCGLTQVNNFRATERLGPELFRPAIATWGLTQYACYRRGRCTVLNHACCLPYPGNASTQTWGYCTRLL
jgi:hypothetical protein